MSNSLVQRANEPEEPSIRVIKFILRLACDSATVDPEVRRQHVSAIVQQLDGISQDSFFPEVLEIINPARFYAQTKQLDDYSKGILTDALDNYCGR